MTTDDLDELADPRMRLIAEASLAVAPDEPGLDAPDEPGLDAPDEPGLDAPDEPGLDAPSSQGGTGPAATHHDDEAVAPDKVVDPTSGLPRQDVPHPTDGDNKPRRKSKKRPQPPAPNPGNKPRVMYNIADLTGTRLAVEEHLRHHPSVPHYQRAGTGNLVVVDILERRPGERRPTIVALTMARLAEHITDVCTIETPGRDGPEAIKPPDQLLRGILEAPNTRFPTLTAISETPTMRPDGTILDLPGYDAATGLFLAPSEDYPPIPEYPTRADAEAALTLLTDVVGDFPFGAEHHRTGAVAAIMTPVLRAGVSGPTPAITIDSPTPGSGKGLLTQVIHVTATGRDGALAPLPKPEVELRKVITAKLLAGAVIWIADNIDVAIGGAGLNALLTSTTWTGRELGFSRDLELDQRMVVILNGNNLVFMGDLRRRVLHIVIDPQVERPEERDDFKHRDLLGYVREHRLRLIVAALTIARAYVVAGRPLAGTLRATGSFEGWSQTVREPLVWLGLPDPWAASQDEIRDGDPDLDNARDLVEALAIAYGDRWFTSAGLLKAHDGDAIARIVGEWTAGAKSQARALTSKFTHFKGRVFGGRRLVRGGRVNDGYPWRVETTDGAK